MRRNIENWLTITVADVDLTKARKIELYLRQGDLFFQFAPEVESRDTLFCIFQRLSGGLSRFCLEYRGWIVSFRISKE